MICPNCHTTNLSDDLLFCPSCGKLLHPDRVSKEEQRKNARQMAKTGVLLGQAARAARLSATVDPNALISDRAYNGVLMGVLLWGFLVNYLLCRFVGNVYMYIHPMAFLVLYLICAFVGVMVAGRSQNALISFLGYNLVVVPFGLVVSTMVEIYGGVHSSVVTNAFLYTLLISLGMLSLSMLFPQFFAKLGGALLGVLIGMVLCEIVLLILGVDQVITDWAAAGLFSLYIGYDIYRSQQFAKTVDNAVDCALDIYMDIANLFLRLLEIMGRRDD